MRGLQRAKNARNWRVRAGRSSPSGWKHFVASWQKREGLSDTATRCRRSRGRRLPLAPPPAARAMGGESAHPCFGRRPVGGANGAYFCIPSEFPRLRWLSNFAWCCHTVPTASPHCQIERGRAVGSCGGPMGVGSFLWARYPCSADAIMPSVCSSRHSLIFIPSFQTPLFDISVSGPLRPLTQIA